MLILLWSETEELQEFGWILYLKRDYLDAMIESVSDSTRIRKLIKGALTDKINDRDVFMK